MKFNILTLFPEMVESGLNTSILGRAAEKKHITINVVNIRDYSLDKHGKVDDYTYGGGAGMLMQAQPVYDAYQAASGGRRLRTIYVTPQGLPFTQKMAVDLAKEEELVFVCGHYEGIDERVLEEIVTDYVSIGDYVLTGGELPAMVMIDAISRLLEYPQYSRPEEWNGKKVPPILLSGDHNKIEEWRLEQSQERTKRIRPDLYEKYSQKQQLWEQLAKNKRSNIHMMESLSRGLGEILYAQGENILIYIRECDNCLICAQEEQMAGKLLDMVPGSTRMIVSSREFLNDMICQRFSFQIYHECYQACYTRKVSLPVRHKDIRPLTMEDEEYVLANYHIGGGTYIAERIMAKELYGAYIDGRLAGFGGIHNDGSMGMLFVDPAYRRMGLGEALEAYIINRQREKGYTPYAHIIVGNEASVKLQERLGLYLSKDTIWWLGN